MSNLVTKTKIKDAFRELTSQSSFAKVKVADIIAKDTRSRVYRYYLDKYICWKKRCTMILLDLKYLRQK